MNNLINIVGLITISITLIYLCFRFFSFVYNYIVFIYETRKSEKEKSLRLNSFYNQIKQNYSELKPFLSSLDKMMNDVCKQELTQSEINKILNSYHFYQDILDKVFEGKPVKENDLIYFAELHVNYNNFVKHWKVLKKKDFIKTTNRDGNFNLFDINLN